MAKSVDTTPPIDECEFSQHDSSDGVSAILAYYAALREYVEHEDELINTRLTWSLTIHGFLFTAFALLITKAADVAIELSKGEHTEQRATLIVVSTAVLCLLPAMVAFVGARLSSSAGGAIEAAHNAIQHVFAITQSGVLRAAAGPIDKPILLPKIIGGGARKPSATDAARSYYMGVPAFLRVVWYALGAIALLLFVASSLLLPLVAAGGEPSLSPSPQPAHARLH